MASESSYSAGEDFGSQSHVVGIPFSDSKKEGCSKPIEQPSFLIG